MPFQSPQPAPVATPLVAAPTQVDLDPARKVACYAGLAMIFVLLSVISELLYFVLHVNTYLLYIFGPVAMLGAVVTGSIGRTFRSRGPYLVVALFIWMVISVPFSSWRSVSFGRVLNFAQFDLPLLVLIGGLIVNWKEIRSVFYTFAAAAGVVLLGSRLFTNSIEEGRVSLEASGTIGNSNDLASHLIFLLPFLMFVTMDPKRNRVLRIALWGPIVYGLWVILGTASRGGVLGLVGAILFILYRGSMGQRFTLLVVVPVLAIVLGGALPQQTLVRLGTLVGQEHEEAKESGESRSYLFKKSVQYTLEHPVFGIGIDTFATYEGGEAKKKGEYGNWHATHCSWTEVSTDCGIPGLLFYLGAWVSSLLLVNRTYRLARQHGNQEIARACFCYLLSLIGFLISITFLSNAYRMYFPLMVGLAVSLHYAAMRQMGLSETAPQPVPVQQPFSRSSVHSMPVR